MLEYTSITSDQLYEKRVHFKQLFVKLTELFSSAMTSTASIHSMFALIIILIVYFKRSKRFLTQKYITKVVNFGDWTQIERSNKYNNRNVLVNPQNPLESEAILSSFLSWNKLNHQMAFICDEIHFCFGFFGGRTDTWQTYHQTCAKIHFTYH